MVHNRGIPCREKGTSERLSLSAEAERGFFESAEKPTMSAGVKFGGLSRLH